MTEADSTGCHLVGYFSKVTIHSWMGAKMFQSCRMCSLTAACDTQWWFSFRRAVHREKKIESFSTHLHADGRSDKVPRSTKLFWNSRAGVAAVSLTTEEAGDFWKLSITWLHMAHLVYRVSGGHWFEDIIYSPFKAVGKISTLKLPLWGLFSIWDLRASGDSGLNRTSCTEPFSALFSVISVFWWLNFHFCWNWSFNLQ